MGFCLSKTLQNKFIGTEFSAPHCKQDFDFEDIAQEKLKVFNSLQVHMQLVLEVPAERSDFRRFQEYSRWQLRGHEKMEIKRAIRECRLFIIIPERGIRYLVLPDLKGTAKLQPLTVCNIVDENKADDDTLQALYYTASGSLRLVCKRLSETWMQNIPDESSLGILTLPASKLPAESETLNRLLTKGVRVFEVPLILEANCFDLFFSAGEALQRLSFKRFQTTVHKFLSAHPSECVIVVIENDSDPKMDSNFYHMLKKNMFSDCWYDWNFLPTLSEVRAKMVLWRRFDLPYGVEEFGLESSVFEQWAGQVNCNNVSRTFSIEYPSSRKFPFDSSDGSDLMRASAFYCGTVLLDQQWRSCPESLDDKHASLCDSFIPLLLSFNAYQPTNPGSLCCGCRHFGERVIPCGYFTNPLNPCRNGELCKRCHVCCLPYGSGKKRRAAQQKRSLTAAVVGSFPVLPSAHELTSFFKDGSEQSLKLAKIRQKFWQTFFVEESETAAPHYSGTLLEVLMASSPSTERCNPLIRECSLKSSCGEIDDVLKAVRHSKSGLSQQERDFLKTARFLFCCHLAWPQLHLVQRNHEHRSQALWGAADFLARHQNCDQIVVAEFWAALGICCDDAFLAEFWYADNFIYKVFQLAAGTVAETPGIPGPDCWYRAARAARAAGSPELASLYQQQGIKSFERQWPW